MILIIPFMPEVFIKGTPSQKRRERLLLRTIPIVATIVPACIDLTVCDCLWRYVWSGSTEDVAERVRTQRTVISISATSAPNSRSNRN